MCNLHGIKTTKLEFLEYHQATEDWRNELAVENDYAAPGKPAYVIRQEDGQRLLSTSRWGFPTRTPRKRPPKAGQSPYIIEWWTNARNLSSNMWRPWLSKAEHRCLVPFTRFAEPKAKGDRKGPSDLNWWFTVKDQPMPCFAGVWKEDPELGRVHAFCTTEPNPLVAPLHPKAMPVILMETDWSLWLTESWEEAQSLVAPYPSQLMAVE